MVCGTLGILNGAGLYPEVYPVIQDNLLKLGGYSKLTIPTLLPVNSRLVIVVTGIPLWMVWLDRES